MSTEPEAPAEAEPDPTTPEGSKLTRPPGVPDGMFLALPKPEVEGEQVPPIPVEFGAGLTDPDVKGHRWMIFTATDGTVTANFRIPWQMGPGLGASIASTFARLANMAASQENGGLIVPGKPAGGGLLVPAPGQPMPPRGSSPLTMGGGK